MSKVGIKKLGINAIVFDLSNSVFGIACFYILVLSDASISASIDTLMTVLKALQK